MERDKVKAEAKYLFSRLSANKDDYKEGNAARG